MIQFKTGILRYASAVHWRSLPHTVCIYCIHSPLLDVTSTHASPQATYAHLLHTHHHRNVPQRDLTYDSIPNTPRHPPDTLQTTSDSSTVNMAKPQTNGVEFMIMNSPCRENPWYSQAGINSIMSQCTPAKHSFGVIQLLCPSLCLKTKYCVQPHALKCCVDVCTEPD